MRYAIFDGLDADLPSLAPRLASLDRAVLRAALAWGDDAPDARGSRCPELDARDAAARHQGPRDVEDDATPSSRPRALEEMGSGCAVADLDALLRSHPEECADALAWLVERSHARGVSRRAADTQGLTAALEALCNAGFAVSGKEFYWLPLSIDARAIARMGAAMWLRDRMAAQRG